MGFLNKLSKKMGEMGDNVANKIKKDEKPATQASAPKPSVSSSQSSASAKPVNHGAGWSRDEEKRLKDGYAAGETIGDLSQRHGRSKNAISYRLIKLGFKNVEVPR